MSFLLLPFAFTFPIIDNSTCRYLFSIFHDPPGFILLLLLTAPFSHLCLPGEKNFNCIQPTHKLCLTMWIDRDIKTFCRIYTN